jgi:hypothetical protein
MHGATEEGKRSVRQVWKPGLMHGATEKGKRSVRQVWKPGLMQGLATENGSQALVSKPRAQSEIVMIARTEIPNGW